MADIINLFYEGDFAHQPSVCRAQGIGDVFFALAFDRSFIWQDRTLAVGLPHDPTHVKRLHSCSMDVDLPSQSSVG